LEISPSFMRASPFFRCLIETMSPASLRGPAAFA
jgi:hypothetical protein